MTGYDTAAEYDTAAQEAALRLIITRSAQLGSRAARALCSSIPASRQMHLDRLIPPFLGEQRDLTAEERQLLADVMWADDGTGTARPPQRTQTIRFRVTQEEEDRIKSAAAAARQTLSDYARERLLGDTP